MRSATAGEVEVRYVTGAGELVTTSLEVVDAARVGEGSPVRRPRSRRGDRHYSGLFWSATNRVHVVYESRLELDRLWLADFDPAVLRIAAQPMWLCGRDGDVWRRHVPDFLLAGASGSVTMVDVKPAAMADDPKVVEVFSWTQRLCATRGWRYEVWSGETATVMANVRALGRARLPGLVADWAVEAAVDRWSPGATVASLTALLTELVAAPAARLAVLAAVWRSHLFVPMHLPLESSTVLGMRSAA